MAVTLGHNQYGKAETRVVRMFRDTEPHEIADYNVSVALVGDFDDVHLLRRQHQVPHHRRHQEHRQRLREGGRRRRPPARVVRHRAGEALRRRRPAGVPVPDPDRGVPVGPAQPRRDAAPARLRPPRLLRPHRHRHLRRVAAVGRVRRA